MKLAERPLLCPTRLVSTIWKKSLVTRTRARHAGKSLGLLLDEKCSGHKIQSIDLA